MHNPSHKIETLVDKHCQGEIANLDRAEFNNFAFMDISFLSLDKSKKLQFSALVDTGATFCVISPQIAATLTLPESGWWTNVEMADGSRQRVKLTGVILEFRGHQLFTIAAILPGSHPLIGILALESLAQVGISAPRLNVMIAKITPEFIEQAVSLAPGPEGKLLREELLKLKEQTDRMGKHLSVSPPAEKSVIKDWTKLRDWELNELAGKGYEKAIEEKRRREAHMHKSKLPACDSEQAKLLERCILDIKERNTEAGCKPAGTGSKKCPSAFAVCNASIGCHAKRQTAMGVH